MSTVGREPRALKRKLRDFQDLDISLSVFQSANRGRLMSSEVDVSQAAALWPSFYTGHKELSERIYS